MELEAAIDSLSRADFLAALQELPEEDQEVALHLRARSDVLTFAACHWSELRHPFAPYHEELLRIPQPGERVITAAFREAGKTVALQELIAHGICNRLPWAEYIVYFSASDALAIQKVDSIGRALEERRSLTDWYGPPLSGRRARGSFRTAWGQHVQAAGIGCSVRGMLEGTQRPSCIVIDDVEDNKIAVSKDRRESLRQWFVSDVAGLLGEGGAMIAIGNVIHSDGLMAWLLKNPAFRHRRIPMVEEWPARADLWEECRKRFIRLEDVNRVETARAFYDAHKAEMTRGGRLAWPERHDWYEDVYRLKWTIGDGPFNAERQCDPRALSGAIRHIVWATLTGRELVAPGRRRFVDSLRCVSYLDHAHGTGRGDYSAIATVGVDSIGYHYVLEVLMARDRSRTEQVRDLFDAATRWNSVYVGCEDRYIEETIEEEQARRQAQGLPWQVGIKRLVQREQKETRLMSLEPALTNEWLLIVEGVPEAFKEQLRAIPDGLHDDGPDAVEGALQVIKKQGLR